MRLALITLAFAASVGVAQAPTEASPEGQSALDASASEAVEAAEVPETPPEPEGASAPEVFTLSNGLQVALQRDPRWSTVGICITYRVGWGEDPDGYSGLAHLTEHMMFTGSPRAPRGFFAVMEPLGGRSINASTTTDRTQYCAEVPKQAVERALFYEADRMGYLLASIDEEKLAIQKRVVLHEYHERGGDSAGANVELALAEALYPDEHRYRVIYEDPDDIEAIELDHVRWFFQRYYTPANATLAVVGDFQTDALRNVIEQYFGVLRGGSAPPSRDLEVPALRGNENIVVDTVFSHEQLMFAWVTPGYYEEGDAALDLAARWLSRTLYDELDNPSYVRRSVRQWSLGRSGRFSIRVTAEEEVDAMDFRETIEAAVRKLQAEPLPADEFADLLARHLGNLRVSFDRPRARASHMSNTGANGQVRSVEDNIARFETITPQDVHRAVRRWLPLNRRVRLLRNFFRYASRAGDVRLRRGN